MAALTSDRMTLERIGDVAGYPVAADTEIFAGALVVLDSGYAKGGATATGLVAVGRADEHVDNSGGAAGAMQVRVKRGVFRVANSASGDLIAQADVGGDCYIVDDQTVALTSATDTRSRAGVVVAVDSDGVWVKIGLGL